MSAKVDLCTISKLMVLMPAAIEVRLPQSLPLAYYVLHYAHPPLEAYSGRFLSLREQDEPGYNEGLPKTAVRQRARQGGTNFL